MPTIPPPSLDDIRKALTRVLDVVWERGFNREQAMRAELVELYQHALKARYYLDSLPVALLEQLFPVAPSEPPVTSPVVVPPPPPLPEPPVVVPPVVVPPTSIAGQPTQMAKIGGANFKLLRDWDFGGKAKLKTLADVGKEFTGHIPEWNTYNLGGDYGADSAAFDTASALPGQLVDTGRYRVLTDSSILLHVRPKVDGQKVGPASTKNAGCGSMYSRFALPSAGKAYGKDVVWETRLRIVNPTAGQWFALWTAGKVWDAGPEMDVIEGFSAWQQYVAGTWHSDAVGTSTAKVNYWPRWHDGQAAAGVIGTGNDLSQFRVITWVYRKDDSYTVYFDGAVIQEGTLAWSVPSTKAAQNMLFLFDFGALHTKVGDYAALTMPASVFPVTCEIDYSRVWER